MALGRSLDSAADEVLAALSGELLIESVLIQPRDETDLAPVVTALSAILSQQCVA
jgi:hypothetical protein